MPAQAKGYDMMHLAESETLRALDLVGPMLLDSLYEE